MGLSTIQEERLSYLLEFLKNESEHYKNIETPKTEDGKRKLLRSLMNVRLPKPLSEEILQVQDEYLKECIEELGIVKLKDVPLAKGILSIWQGDITRLEVDAIVNAANSQMLGCFIPMHTCIDNCIHTFSGMQLRVECAEKMQVFRKVYGEHYEQATAIPMLTEAYNLPSKKIIHVVGPIVTESLTVDLEKDLANTYKNVLDLCLENHLKTVAFCCISTGVFRFPAQRASEIAVKTVEAWLKEHPGAMDRVIFNVFKDEDRVYYEKLLSNK